MNILIAIGIFIATLFLIEGGYALLRTWRNPEKKRVRRWLTTLAGTRPEEEEDGLERRVLLSEVPWLNRLLMKLDWTQKLHSLLEQAGVQKPLGFFVLLSLVMAGVGIIAGWWLTYNYLVSTLLAAVLSAIPYLSVILKRKGRMEKFERQLPQALDLMGRALKAGHAFTGGLKIVADEMDEPIGLEFNKTLAEINFGIEIPEALKNLSLRVECPDLRFFVISIIIQRETGGNLAEILGNISYLIRERFKLHGRIRVLSAEGKFSAIVLIALPFLVAGILAFLNPDYLKVLITDPIGHIMVGFAFGMMMVGILVMKKMVAIKV